MRAIRSVVTIAIAVCLFAFIASCGSGGDSGGAAGATGSITLTTDADSILADGSSSANITALVLDSAGNPVRHFTDVTFSTTLGHFRNGSSTYTVQTQPPLVDGKPDIKAPPTGIAKVALISGTTPGVAKVTVSSNQVTNLVRITFTHAGNTGVPAPEEFSLSAAYLNISGLWKASLQDKITASVGDIYGNAVADSTPIAFKTYNTGGFFSVDIDPTVGGLASSTLYTTGGPTPLQGFVSLTAETTGGSSTRVTALEVVPYPDQHIMYAGTDGGGIYKSTNYGATWETVSRSTQNPRQGQNLIDPYIKGHSAIAVDPDNHNVVYAGTGYLGKGNVFRSLDGAMNWNSNNVEQWNGLYETTAAVLTVVADGDDDATTDYPYVWIGTEGRGPLYAADGKTFQPSGGIATTPAAGAGNTGNGTMSQPVLSYSSKTETWTATCAGSTAAATTPTFSGTGNGGMSAVTTSSSTVTETWSVIYQASVGDVTQTGTGNGKVSDIAMTNPNVAVETWTLTCTSTGAGGTASEVTGTARPKGNVTGISVSATGPAEETFTLRRNADVAQNFTVIGDKGGSFGTILADGAAHTLSDSSATYTITMTISVSVAPNLYLTDETFIFSWTKSGGTFSVCSNVAGCYSDATVGKTYSDSGLTFIIRQGTTAFAVGDTFTFTITIDWYVSGTVSGPQTNTATTGTAYTSDSSEVSFTIWQGTTDYAIGDTFTFSTTAGLTYWIVAGTVSGTQAKLAFASNDTIVQGYYSDGREVYFVITEGTTPFAVGDTFSFAVTANTLNHGWTVWDMVKVPDTHGATAILYAGTATGVYKTTNGAQTWSSLTLFTGDYIIALALYPTATGAGTDIIYAGTQNAGVWASSNSGTTWTQYVAGIDSGQGATIKDLMVDPVNHRLYAIAYNGPVTGATGSVYVHTLNSNGTMTSDPWVKANTGLTGTALHALGSDIPSSPSAIFVGGEGISLHKATSGLDSGTPSWYESKSGISNLIMARMPVLFSGECFMTVYRMNFGDGRSYFEIYIEDINGNPPIMGSTFSVKGYDSQDTLLGTYWDITYPECYTTPHGSFIHGTFRDPSDGATNDPYWVLADYRGDLAYVTFEFTPTCEAEAPGCSGSTQSVSYWE